jgi:hypothetical protein
VTFGHHHSFATNSYSVSVFVFTHQICATHELTVSSCKQGVWYCGLLLLRFWVPFHKTIREAGCKVDSAVMVELSFALAMRKPSSLLLYSWWPFGSSHTVQFHRKFQTFNRLKFSRLRKVMFWKERLVSSYVL